MAWWISAALLPVGIWLATRGLKARRIDNHPLCSRCGYDLFRRDLPSPCPECGRAATTRNITIGHRTRHRPMMTAGAVLLAVALATYWGSSRLHGHIRQNPWHFVTAIHTGDLARVNQLLTIDPKLAMGWHPQAYPGFSMSHTPAYFAYTFGHTNPRVFARIMQEPIDVNAVESGQAETLLAIALERDDRALVQQLLSRGADPNLRVHAMFGLTPTFQLGLRDRSPQALNIVQLMKQHGADLNLTDARGGNALHAAVSNGCDPSVITWLIEQGADVFQQDRLGRTPTHWAAGTYNTSAFLPPLLAAGGSLTTRDFQGFMPGETSDARPGKGQYDYRVEVWHTHVVHPLANAKRIDQLYTQLKIAGDVRTWRSKFKNFNLLQYAAEKGDLASVQALLDYGFDVNQRVASLKSDIYSGATALYLATMNLNNSVAQALLNAGADPAIRNAQGMTPADRARDNNDYKMADMIESYLAR